MRSRAPAKVRIRPGTEADIDDIVRIAEAIWRHSLAQVMGLDGEDWPRLAGQLHADLIPIAREVLVAAQASRAVGYSYRRGAMIDDLWVDPLFQGAGIGPQLLWAQVAAIAAEGHRTASLECLEGNIEARRFYEREGWRPVYRYARALRLFPQSIPRIRFEYDVWRSR